AGSNAIPTSECNRTVVALTTAVGLTWPPATSSDGASWSILGTSVLASQSPGGVCTGGGVTAAAVGLVESEAAQANATPIVNERAMKAKRSASRRSRVTWRIGMTTTV